MARARGSNVAPAGNSRTPRGVRSNSCDAQLVLERPDLAAERRLRQVQARGRAADVALLGDGDEILELRQTHGSKLSTAAEIEKVLDRPSGRPGRVERWQSTSSGRPRSTAMRRAGRAAAATLAAIAARIAPGISTGDIDAWVREDTRGAAGGPASSASTDSRPRSAPAATPSSATGSRTARERLAAGDIINVDVTTELGGFHGDTSATLFVGAPSAEARHVVETARRCRDAGIAEVRAGARLGDIGAAIEELAAREGCSVVRELGGHGIGRAMHAPPTIAHVGPRGTGLRLREGMAITIEPMINLGRPRGASARRRLDDRHRRRLAVGPVRAHGAGHARRVRGPHPPLTHRKKRLAPVSIRPAAVRRPGRRRQEP